MKVLVIDNRDSFVHNLVDLLARIAPCTVVRNSADVADVAAELDPETVLCLSPGPGRPSEAGCMPALLAHGEARRVPTLGICLGFQAILEHFGQPVDRVGAVHGVARRVEVTEAGSSVLAQHVAVGRYHSLGVRQVPASMQVWARTDDGIVMAAGHRDLPIAGLQFHPESILTQDGPHILTNLLNHLLTTSTTLPTSSNAEEHHHD